VVAAALALLGLVGPFRLKLTGGVKILLASVAVLWIPYIIVFSVGIYHFVPMMIMMPLIGAVASAIREEGLGSSLKLIVHSKLALASLLILLAVQIEYAYWMVKFL